MFVEHFAKHGLGNITAKKLARALDKDKSGEITQHEYLSFFSVHIGGTEEEKISSFFIILDSDGMNLHALTNERKWTSE